MQPPAPSTPDDWRKVLTGEYPPIRAIRHLFERIPTDPRCKLCSAPFGGIGGRIMPAFGFGRWEGNASLCKSCFRGFEKTGPGGAEIDVSLLFADIRGSTGIAERLQPVDFSRLLERFYGLASEAILRHDGLIDKLVGDEVVAMFLPAIAGAGHAAHAIEAARAVLAAVGAPDASPMGPIPVGAGIHTGTAFVGVVGQTKAAWDFTAVGDPVNTAARLAAAAKAGEVLVSLDAASAAGLALDGLDRRPLDVRGRSEPIEVVSLLA